jgi:tRNA threonylcarbamoyladenosine biosynthesis protein TsaB
MDYLLHIDASSDTCSIAISSNGKLLNQKLGKEARNHASAINLMIAQSLEEINISISDIAAVVVCSGPGSYTGLRIALATAKGICYAANKPMLMNDKLGLLALKAPGSSPENAARNTAAILVAREKEYFISIYNNSYMCTLEPTHVTEEELPEILKGIENLHIISNAANELFYQLKVNFSSFSADITIDFNNWAVLAEKQFKCQEFVNIANSTPLYLKQVYTHK